MPQGLAHKFKEIIAAYYWAAYLLHHALRLRPGKPLENSRLVVVGSFRAGGAGKTPFCLWLAKELLKNGKTVTVLCHKYALDEGKMYRQALDGAIRQGMAEVVITGNRYKTAIALDHHNPPDVILCDDGFEDSRLRPDLIFRLDWEKAPTEIRQLIPAGRFRSLRQDHLKYEPRTVPVKCFGPTPDAIFRIGSIANADGCHPQFEQSIAVCGIGDPERFFKDLEKEEYPLQEKFIYPDHDKNFSLKLENILRKHPRTNVIITEKDSFRLSRQLLENPQVYVARQAVTITKGFLKTSHFRVHQ